MKLAETVTFGGSGFDRAGELRSDPAAQTRLLADAATRSIAFWRGKPLIIKEESVYMQAGAGIVYDSDPETEYEETENKVRALIETFTK